MSDLLVGSEALASGALTRGQLRWRYRAMFPDIYLPRTATPTLAARIRGAALWSHGTGIIAGRAAAVLHGALWVDQHTPIEMIVPRDRAPAGIVARNERIYPDEICMVGEYPVTSPERTAFDLGRHLPRDDAVKNLDALARATGVSAADALALIDCHPRARGLRNAENVLALMDGGAQSPKETWLRLLLIDAGYPRPRTQIRVSDGFNEAFLDLGWDEPKIGLDYDGPAHQIVRGRFVHDIGRRELIERQEWIDIHVVAEHSRAFILHRVREAYTRRGIALKLRPGLQKSA